MTNKPELKIEAGRFYRDGTGKKVRIYATDGQSGYPIHAAVLHERGWVDECYTRNGKFASGRDNQEDLISEWIDAPEVDWSKMAAWHICVAKNESGSWRAFCEKPNRHEHAWVSVDTDYECIPAHYAPKFTGDWKDSLVFRPGVEK